MKILRGFLGDLKNLNNENWGKISPRGEIFPQFRGVNKNLNILYKPLKMCLIVFDTFIEYKYLD